MSPENFRVRSTIAAVTTDGPIVSANCAPALSVAERDGLVTAGAPQLGAEQGVFGLPNAAPARRNEEAAVIASKRRELAVRLGRVRVGPLSPTPAQ